MPACIGTSTAARTRLAKRLYLLHVPPLCVGATCHRVAQAGFKTMVYHLLPWSQPKPGAASLPFHAHFLQTVDRLRRVLPTLERHGIRLGLEMIGAFGLRRVREHDFVHTVEVLHNRPHTSPLRALQPFDDLALSPQP